MTTVLDSFALLAFLRAEPGFETVPQVIADAPMRGDELLMTAVNVGEAFYLTERRRGKARLPALEKALEELPMDIVDADLELAKRTAALKAHKKMSYADCFAADLVSLRGARLVTGDKKFKQVEADIETLWI